MFNSLKAYFARDIGTRTYVIFIALAVIVFYAHTLQGKFVYDDTLVIDGNSFVTKLSNAKDLFTKRYFSESKELSYRPVCTASYFLDYALFGVHSFGYRLHNLILHIFCAIAIFFFLQRLFTNRNFALCGALLFALHPAAVESVCAPSNREELYAALFFVLGIMLFTRGKYFWSAVSYLIAMFSKEMAVTMPLIIILTPFPLPRWERVRERVKGCFWLAAAAAFYLIIRFCVFYNPFEKVVKYNKVDLLTRIWTMGPVFRHYIKTLFLPLNLNADYFFENKLSFFSIDVWPNYILVFSLILAALLIAKKYPKTSLGILWFFITLLPVSNIIPIENIGADRYLYIPLIGFAIFMPGIVDELTVAFKKAGLLLLFAICILFGLLTYDRVKVWQDDFTLWSDSVKKSPYMARVRNNYGNALLWQGKTEGALKEFKTALAIDPKFAVSLKNMECIYETRFDFEKAMHYNARVLKLEPKDPIAYYHIGNVYFKIGKLEDALTAYREALKFKKKFPEVLNNMGVIYDSMGEFDKAIVCYNKALELVPKWPDVYVNIGAVYAAKGMYDKAEESYKTARKLDPQNHLALEGLRKVRRLREKK